MGAGGSSVGAMVTVSEERRRSLVRRTTLLLAGAQLSLWGAIGVFAAFGAILGPTLAGRDGEAAILFGLFYVGTAAGAPVAGRVMDRFGRRPGLAAGYVVLAAAGGLASFAATQGSLGWLRAAFLLEGVGVEAALLGRAAVADLYPPDRRGRAVGLLIMAGTIGAVGGPPLGGVVQALATAAGLPHPLALPWLLGSVLGIVALALVAALRPDPRDLALRAEGVRSRRRKPHEILLGRPGLVAVVTIAAAQAVMVTLMGVIPEIVHGHGATDLTVTLVVSVHLGAMFAFSPFLGSLLDSRGRRMGLLLGVALLGGGVILALAGPEPFPGGGGLLLIGVGWSAAYLGSTTVISDLTRPEERGATLGAADQVAGVAAAAGAIGAAFLFGATSFGVVAVAAMAVLAVPLALLLWGSSALRSSVPARPIRRSFGPETRTD